MSRLKDRKKIKERFKSPSNTLFATIATLMGEQFPVPVVANVSPAPKMDIKLVVDYGERYTSATVDYFHDNQSTEQENLDSTAISQLAEYLISIYGDRWIRSADALFAEYDPIHNYLDEWEDTLARTDVLDGESVRTDDRTDTDTKNLSEDYTRTNDLQDLRTDNLSNSMTRTDNLEQGVSGSDSNSVNNSLYGFNSANAVPSDGSSESGSNASTTTNTGTQTTDGTNTGTQTTSKTGTVHDVTSNTGTDTVTHTGTVRNEQDDSREIGQDRSGRHFGNIGNLTSQKMILEEIELRKLSLMNEMVKNVADEITIPMY